MRVVFMGTPDLAARILCTLAERHDVAAVFTRADAVRGRGNKAVPSPVKVAAQNRGIPVYSPASLKDGEVLSLLRGIGPQAICVAAYGMMIPREILGLPQFGCLNVHASLLPRWRGAAPIERAVLAGDEWAGVCIMRMEETLDTGDYCLASSVEIGRKDAASLSAELADLGGHALADALDALEQGRSIEWAVQDEEKAVYAHKIGKGELDLDPMESAVDADRKVRAASDSHPARAIIAGKQVSVLQAVPCEDEALASDLEYLLPGQARYYQKKLFLRCGDGLLQLLRLRPSGKSDMDAASFAAGIQGSKKNILAWERFDV